MFQRATENEQEQVHRCYTYEGDEYCVPLYRDPANVTGPEAARQLGAELGVQDAYIPGRRDRAEAEGRVIAAFRCGWLVARRGEES